MKPRSFFDYLIQENDILRKRMADLHLRMLDGEDCMDEANESRVAYRTARDILEVFKKLSNSKKKRVKTILKRHKLIKRKL